MQGLYIDLCSYARDLQQRLNFRCERQSPSSLDVVEGLDAKMIAGEKNQRRAGTKSQIPKANIPFRRLTHSGPSSS